MRTTVRRATIALALTPLLSLPAGLTASAIAGVGHGSTTVSTPAPPGDASAVAAEVNGVITVGKSVAHAGSDGGSADADALSVLGQQVSGGSQKGVGSKTGNLIGTGDTPVGDAEVAPWTAKVTNNNGGYQSHAEAALAHADIADLVELWVLHSISDAAWAPGASSGDAQSDGAEVSALGQLDIKVLHSEAHSSGKGHSDLLVVNGTEIGSSDQANGACKLDVSPVIDLLCLTAKGGTGADGVTSAGSDVASFVAGGGALTGTVSGSSASGAKAGTPALPTPSQAAHRPQRSSAARPPAATPSQSASSLPFTGADTERSVLVALAMTAIGATATLFGRRRRFVLS